MTQEHKHNSIPLFSIIIPTYNHGHLIGRCLDSVVGQSCEDWEAIVVNNFSNDNTVEVVESYHDSRIRLINFANNGIIAASRNKGMSEARGEWICFLDSDDWWTPNKLETCQPYLADHDLIYHKMQLYSERQGLLRGKFTTDYHPHSPIFLTLLRKGNCCANSSVVLRSRIARQAGPINQSAELVAVEDYDYWIRISQISERFCYIPKVLGYYWVSDTSASSGNKWFDRHQALYAQYHSSIKDPQKQKTVVCGQAYHTARVYCHYSQFQEAKSYYKIALHSPHLKTKLAALFFLIHGLLFNRHKSHIRP